MPAPPPGWGRLTIRTSQLVAAGNDLFIVFEHHHGMGKIRAPQMERKGRSEKQLRGVGVQEPMRRTPWPLGKVFDVLHI